MTTRHENEFASSSLAAAAEEDDDNNQLENTNGSSMKSTASSTMPVITIDAAPPVIVSFRDWWNHETLHSKETSGRPLLLLDLREQLSEQDWQFLDNDSSNNGSNELMVVNIPWKKLSERSFELPPRHFEMALLLDCSSSSVQLEEVQRFFFGGDRNKGRRRRRQQPWKISALLDASLSETWQQAMELGLAVGKGKWRHHHHPDNADDDDFERTSHRPLPRLWQPDTMVEQVLLPLLKEQFQEQFRMEQQLLGDNKDDADQVTMNEIWDLGAGAGRDVCFLAEELQHYYYSCQQQQQPQKQEPSATVTPPPPFCVVALDQRYRNTASTTTTTTTIAHNNNKKNAPPEQFFQRRNVSSATRCQQINLLLPQQQQQQGGSENEDDDKNDNQSALFSQILNHGQEEGSSSSTSGSNDVHCRRRRRVVCLYAVRYWNRRLVQEIASSSSSLPKGTLFAISTFGKSHVGAEWNHAHPSERHVLERDELRNLFSTNATSSSGWTIRHDQVVHDSDHGRTLIQFVAQKN